MVASGDFCQFDGTYVFGIDNVVCRDAAACVPHSGDISIPLASSSLCSVVYVNEEDSFTVTATSMCGVVSCHFVKMEGGRGVRFCRL